MRFPTQFSDGKYINNNNLKFELLDNRANNSC
ncbi:hypothetical protein EDF58_10568 [Novosphingobium sp. PhB57]|nr:hypothetical protein EDF58_10568 [Novosphingobium sp. PhB57]TDW67446.1 hypothetical protein EDF57_102332 [Novosphingobium sp. PhB55]